VKIFEKGTSAKNRRVYMAKKDKAQESIEATEDADLEGFEVQKAEYAGDILRDVEARTVDMVQSGAQSIVADTVRLELAVATTITAHQVDMAQSGAVSIDADEVHATGSRAIAIRGQEIQLAEGGAVVVLGSTAAFDEAITGLVVTSSAHVSGGRVGVLLARHVDGEVTTVLDTRSALGLGAMLGTVFGAFVLLITLLTRRR
jgi:hypothetical protein